jgi:hypothetical protein
MFRQLTKKLIIVIVLCLSISTEFTMPRKAYIYLRHNLYIVGNSLRLGLLRTEAPVNRLALVRVYLSNTYIKILFTFHIFT